MFRMLRHVLLGLAVLPSVSARADGYTEYDTLKIPPSNLSGSKVFTPDQTFTFENYIGCFVYNTGTPITCSFTYKVLGLEPPVGASANNGGHLHDYYTHPVVWPADGALSYNFVNYPPLTGILNGVTTIDAGSDEPGYARIKHVMPEVAGQIQTEMVTTLPYGWRCYGSCYTFNSWRDVTTLDVRVPDDLSELPATSLYSLCGMSSNGCVPDPNHPLTHSGTVLMNSRIASMAALYFTYVSGNRLQINDVSLPKGGLFDVGSDWSQPHQTHRAGKAVDINRTTIAPDGSRPPVNITELIKYGKRAGLKVKTEVAPVCSIGTDNNPCFHVSLIE